MTSIGFHEDRIQTTHGKLWHCVFGADRPGVPLLVVHGGPGFLSMTETVRDLADERPVHFYDQLGCGRSDKAADPAFYSPEHYVHELAEVCEALGLDEVLLMGFSWGAILTALYLLEKQPVGVKAAMFCAPLLGAPSWDADQRENILRMPQNVQQAIQEGDRSGNFGDEAYQNAMLAYYRRHLCRLDPWPDYVQEAFGKLDMDVYGRLWGPSEFTITGKLKDYDLLPRLHDITIPVLLTCGDFDEAGVKTLKDCQLTMPSAYLAVLPNASHLHHLEKPDLFLCIIRVFLKDLFNHAHVHQNG